MNKQIKLPIQNSKTHIVIDVCTDNPEVPRVSVGLERNDGSYLDVLALDQFDANRADMTADHLSLYVWGDANDEDYTHKFKYEIEGDNDER